MKKERKIKIERVGEIESPSELWKSPIITFIRYPQFARPEGFEPPRLGLEAKMLPLH